MSEVSVHRVRLKGPWDVIPPDSANQAYERRTMPAAWRSGFGEVAGTASFRRRFHCPTGLTRNDCVMIHFPTGIGRLSDIAINGTSVEPIEGDSIKVDVTAYLIEFNAFTFDLSFHPQEEPDIPGGLWETVFLEIHASVDSSENH